MPKVYIEIVFVWRNRLLRQAARNQDQYLALVKTFGHDTGEGQKGWRLVLETYSGIIESIENPNRHSKVTNLVRFAHPAYDGAISSFLSNHPEILETVFASIQQLLQTRPGTHLTQDIVWLLPHWHQGRPSREAQVLIDYLVSDDIQLLITLAENYDIRFPFTQNVSLKSAIRGITQHPLAQGNNNLIRQVFIKAAHVLKSMPMGNRCEILLLGISNNPYLMGMAMHRPYDLVCRHYHEVTDEARDHLDHYLENNNNSRQVVGRSLGNYYDLLPLSLRQVAEDIAIDSSFSAYLAQKELITGIVLGYGQYNKEAHHLINLMAKGDNQKTHAYLASSLVLIYDQHDGNIRQVWDNLVHEDNPQCVVAVAERIISLSTDQIQLDLLRKNGLLDFALSSTESNLPQIRAELLRILLDSRKTLQMENVETRIKGLLHDDDDVTRGAAFYWMLSNSELQTEFPGRFQELLTDNSVYANLGKLLYYTNSQSKVPTEIEEQVEELMNTETIILRNALLFHIAAQQPFLPSNWGNWLEAQLDNDDVTDSIINLGKQHHPDDDRSRPIFEPNWLTNYEYPIELIWFQPQKSYMRMSTGTQAIVKKLDELNLIFHLKEEFPDYLDC